MNDPDHLKSLIEELRRELEEVNQRLHSSEQKEIIDDFIRDSEKIKHLLRLEPYVETIEANAADEEALARVRKWIRKKLGWILAALGAVALFYEHLQTLFTHFKGPPQ